MSQTIEIENIYFQDQSFTMAIETIRNVVKKSKNEYTYLLDNSNSARKMKNANNEIRLSKRYVLYKSLLKAHLISFNFWTYCQR